MAYGNISQTFSCFHFPPIRDQSSLQNQSWPIFLRTTEQGQYSGHSVKHQ